MPTSSTTTPLPSFPGNCKVNISGAGNPDVYIYENGNAAPSASVSPPGGNFTFLPNKSYLFSIKQMSGAAPGAYSFSVAPTTTTTPYPTPVMALVQGGSILNKSNGVAIVAGTVPNYNNTRMKYSPELNMWAVCSVLTAGVGRVIFSNNEGDTWYSASIDGTKPWYDIAYGVVSGTPTFVAVSSTAIAYSNNGVNYTSVNVGTVNQGIAFGNQTFIAYPRTGGNRTIYRSTDGGLTWTTLTNALPVDNWTRLVYGNGKWLATSVFSNATAYSTDNGTTWTSGAITGAAGLGGYFCTAWDGTRFVAVQGGLPFSSYNSTDGITWSRGLDMTSTPMNICVDSGITYVTQGNNGQLRVSPNGFASAIGTLSLTVSGAWYPLAGRNPPVV